MDHILNDTAEGGLCQLRILQERLRAYVRLLDNKESDYGVRQNHIDHLVKRIIAEPQDGALVVELDRTEALNEATARSIKELQDDLRALGKEIGNLEITTIAHGSRQVGRPPEPSSPPPIDNLDEAKEEVRDDFRAFGQEVGNPKIATIKIAHDWRQPGRMSQGDQKEVTMEEDEDTTWDMCEDVSTLAIV